MILAVDPGRSRCGVVLLDDSGGIADRRTVERSRCVPAIVEQVEAHEVDVLVLGMGTSSRRLEEEIRGCPGWTTPIHWIDERDSTLEARRLYFELHPPRGLWRFVPVGLQSPPEPYDDLAAVILGRRYLASRNK